MLSLARLRGQTKMCDSQAGVFFVEAKQVKETIQPTCKEAYEREKAEIHDIFVSKCEETLAAVKAGGALEDVREDAHRLQTLEEEMRRFEVNLDLHEGVLWEDCKRAVDALKKAAVVEE